MFTETSKIGVLTKSTDKNNCGGPPEVLEILFIKKSQKGSGFE